MGSEMCIRDRPNVYWLEEVVGSVAQRFGEWASASRTFSAVTDLLAAVEREVATYLACLHFLVHARPTSCCLPAEIID